MHDHSSVPLGHILGKSRGESRVTARPSMFDDLNFEAPFSCLVSGSSGSGITSFCIRFLQNLKELCTVADFSGGIVYCYSEISAVPYRQLPGKEHVLFTECRQTNNSGEKPCLIILDYLLNDTY